MVRNNQQEIDNVKKLLGVKRDKDLAAVLGVEQSTISTWKQRGIPDAQQMKILRLAKYDELPPDAKPVRRIPVLGSIPAGFPEYVAEEVGEWVYRSDLPEEAYALRIKGDSMLPLEDGDYVAFIRNGDYQNKDIVVAHNEWGEFMVKRLRSRPDGSQLLTSDNPKYGPIEPNEHYRIIGKVIKAWRELL